MTSQKLRLLMTYQESKEIVDRLADGLGMPIDEKIKYLVAAMRMYGVRTTMSCEGHLDRGSPYPWIRFDAEDVYLVGALINIKGIGKKRTVREIIESHWVMEPHGKEWVTIPRHPSRPLEILQADAHEFAASLVFFSTFEDVRATLPRLT